jgi:hypothetical protein
MISGVSRNLGTAQVLVLVIESGMIYSAALIIEISCYFSGSNAFYIVYDPIAQLTVGRRYPFSSVSHPSHFGFAKSIVPTKILLLVAFKQTSSDIKTRANGSGRSSGSTTLPTVNFRTNPDLISMTTTTDTRGRDFPAPKVAFESVDPTTSSESTSKRGSFKTNVVELDPRVSTTNSEGNVEPYGT